jgi:hypothetical protein
MVVDGKFFYYYISSDFARLKLICTYLLNHKLLKLLNNSRMHSLFKCSWNIYLPKENIFWAIK